MAQAQIIEGVIQPYAWGGKEYLANLLSAENPGNQPMAELWLGAHPKGPAKLSLEGLTLDEWIARQPSEELGKAVAERFNDRLPFLLKILDVKDMLSIQVHPNKAAAEIGFAREEANGPERTAPNRNYRDDNHKPELGVALTDFYLLHGFKSTADIQATLMEVPGWESLLPVLKKEGVPGLYRTVMSASQEEIDTWLQPVVNHISRNKRMYHRHQPEFWVRRAAEQYGKDDHHDRGIFSIYWFNIVHLRPGEGIFQDAGIPHAYLEGACVELMANSDNVLRGGLTPKHIDVPELLDKTDCSAVTANILTPTNRGDGWQHYPTPAPDFSLSVATPSKDEELTIDTAKGPAILLLLEGALQDTATSLQLDTSSRTAFLAAEGKYTFSASANTKVFLAEVGDAHSS